jgi:S1-C subfamily serine protease
MKWSTNQVLIAFCLFAAGGVSLAGAQQTTERERRRMEEAQARAQEAQRELQRALELLQQQQESDEARERLDDAIRELQRARSRLGYEGSILGITTPSNLYFSTSRRGAPQMGVYLNMEQRPSTDSIGVVVNSVTEDGPAWDAGLRDGDIVTIANGESLARTSRRGTSPANKLIQLKDDMEEGDTLHVQYRRGATTHSTDIELRYLDDLSAVFEGPNRAVGWATPDITVLDGNRGAFNVAATMFSGQLSLLGILDVELVELDEELGWYFGVDKGLLVVRAPEDNDVLDLRSGDVIVSIDGREPASQTQLVRILRSYEDGETMEISIMRQRQPMTLEATVPERDTNVFWRRDGRY